MKKFILFTLIFMGCNSESNQGANYLYPAYSSEHDANGNRLWGYISEKGAWIIRPKFYCAQPFSENRAQVCLSSDGSGVQFINSSGDVVINRYDLNSSKQITHPTYSSLFSEGLAPVLNSEKKIVYIDSIGNEVIKTTSAMGSSFSEGFAYICQDFANCNYLKRSKILKKVFAHPGPFKEGLAKACKIEIDPIIQIPEGGKCGFIDSTMNWKLPPIYEDAGDFSEGLAPVSINRKYGFINRKGEIVIRPEFYQAWSFVGGLAAFQVGGDRGPFGFLKKDGSIFVNPTLLGTFGFFNNLAWVDNGIPELNGLNGFYYINKNGAVVWGSK